jgi:hypothetical protein
MFYSRERKRESKFVSLGELFGRTFCALIGISVPICGRPATLWPGKADVTINVIKDGNKLASAKSVKNFDGQRLATARVKVPSGGNVLIRAKGSGNQPLDLELYIGVLKTSR